MKLSQRFPAVVIVFLFTCVGCLQLFSRDEVARVSSPDNRVDAILFETNGGATTSFGYEIEIARKGNHAGSRVATLYGAARNDQAYGVNLSWKNNDKLVMTYLSTEQPPVVRDAIDIDGKHIQISAEGGVNDPNAPSGGMLYNLGKK